MRRRVDIQQQAGVADSTGSVVPTWTAKWTAVPCAVAAFTLRGHESFSGQQVQSDESWKITLRWRPDLDASMRLVEWLDKARTRFTVYNIEAVMPDVTNRREITLLCRTRLSEGFRADGG